MRPIAIKTMKNTKRWPSITIFVIMQVAWVSVVTLWIIWYIKYWYVKYHYALIEHIGAWDIVVIVEVSILLLLILIGIVILFVLYQRQVTLTRTQTHLISAITHEFKTPLATTQLYLETMLKRELPEETRQQLLTGLLSENQRLKSLVENYLESARLSYRNRSQNLSPQAISEIISRFLKRHETLVGPVEVSLEIEEGLLVNVDEDAFDLVLSNLTENAIHYSSGRARIDIRAWSEAKRTYIDFSDAGIGIPRERHKDVFKMFQRLPEGIALWGTGTGMGLYVVKEIIKAHGGKIRVRPSSSENGTSFLIQLPRATA